MDRPICSSLGVRYFSPKNITRVKDKTMKSTKSISPDAYNNKKYRQQKTICG